MSETNANTGHERALEIDAFRRALSDEPFRFDFFQAVRRLEAARADLPRVGSSTRRHEDPVSFRQQATLAFAPAMLSSFVLGAGGAADTLTVRAPGLLGPNGPLPLNLTEYARERERRHRDPTFARFLDVFHHRILSLFYRAWRETNQAASHDRPGEDAIAGYLASLIGIGMESLRDRDQVPDAAKIHFAGRLVTQPRNAEGLEDILRGDLGVPARVEEFAGDWETIPSRYRLRLGESDETGRLGLNAHLGARFWDAQQRFRIVLGPMSLETYRRLLPPPENGERPEGSPPSDWFRLRDWIRNYVGFEMTWDVRMILAEVPELRLGHPDARLARSSWLRVASRAFPRLASDLIIDGERVT